MKTKFTLYDGSAMTDINSISPSPDELVSKGERIYFEKKDVLEREHYGEYIIIEVETGEMFIDKDKLQAIQAAQKNHPGKLFYIVQIGSLKQDGPQLNETKRYGWAF